MSVAVLWMIVEIPSARVKRPAIFAAVDTCIGIHSLQYRSLASHFVSLSVGGGCDVLDACLQQVLTRR